LAINLIVAAVTLLMAGFVTVWILSPPLRAWMESPKVRFIDRTRRFPQIVRDEKKVASASSQLRIRVGVLPHSDTGKGRAV